MAHDAFRKIPVKTQNNQQAVCNVTANFVSEHYFWLLSCASRIFGRFYDNVVQ